MVRTLALANLPLHSNPRRKREGPDLACAAAAPYIRAPKTGRTTVKKILLLLLATVAVFVSCTKEPLNDGVYQELAEADRVVFEPSEVPYPALSTYRFFKGRLANLRPTRTVLPFAPLTPLFTDYAEKQRFVWMPEGVKAQYNGADKVMQFPEGSVLIKNFYYDGVQPGNVRRIIETRILFKREGVWEFANYVWNAEQTEAYLDLNGSVTPVTWTDAQGTTRSIQYRIPSLAECRICHSIGDEFTPIGPKPQNLNGNYAFSAGVRNQLQQWAAHGFLEQGYPKRILSTVAWNDVSKPLALRARSYLDANCAHCHADDHECAYRAIRLNFNTDGGASNLGICMEPEDPFDPSLVYNVAPNNIVRSMVRFRMNTNDEATRMPQLGRTVVHTEGVALIEQWIQSLTQTCN